MRPISRGSQRGSSRVACGKGRYPEYHGSTRGQPWRAASVVLVVLVISLELDVVDGAADFDRAHTGRQEGIGVEEHEQRDLRPRFWAEAAIGHGQHRLFRLAGADLPGPHLELIA